MKSFTPLAAASVLTVALAGSAVAQDTMDPAAGMTEMTLPEACQTAAAPPAMGGMEEMQSAMESMDEAQMAFMQGMMATEGPMMQGMMAEDTDIAFACAMIPHHQGAINMAEVELRYGDNEEMKEMARIIIEDQRREIAKLTRLIEEETE